MIDGVCQVLEKRDTNEINFIYRFERFSYVTTPYYHPNPCARNSQLVLDQIVSRAYSRPLLVTIIAPTPVPLFLKKIFSLEIVKNDICLGVQANKMPFFKNNISPKNAPMPRMSRIGPAKGMKNF